MLTLREGYKGHWLFYHIAAVTLAFFAASILDPFIEFYRALPPLAYNTLIVLWLGFDDESKIVMLFLSACAPIFIQTMFGVQRILIEA